MTTVTRRDALRDVHVLLLRCHRCHLVATELPPPAEPRPTTRRPAGLTRFTSQPAHSRRCQWCGRPLTGGGRDQAARRKITKVKWSATTGTFAPLSVVWSPSLAEAATRRRAAKSRERNLTHIRSEWCGRPLTGGTSLLLGRPAAKFRALRRSGRRPDRLTAKIG